MIIFLPVQANEIFEKLCWLNKSFDEELSGLVTDDKARNEEFEDDGFVHVYRGNLHAVFYRGQDKGALTQNDVRRLGLLTDHVIESVMTHRSIGSHGLEKEDEDFRPTREESELR